MTKPRILLVSILVRLLAAAMIIGVCGQAISQGTYSLAREFLSGWIGFSLLYIPLGVFSFFCLFAPASKLHQIISTKTGIILFIAAIGSSVINDIWVFFNLSRSIPTLVPVLLQALSLGILIWAHFSMRLEASSLEKEALADQWQSYWKIKKWEETSAESNTAIYFLKFVLLGVAKLICVDFYGISCPSCRLPYFKKSMLALNPTPTGCEHCGMDSKDWAENANAKNA